MKKLVFLIAGLLLFFTVKAQLLIKEEMIFEKDVTFQGNIIPQDTVKINDSTYFINCILVIDTAQIKVLAIGDSTFKSSDFTFGAGGAAGNPGGVDHDIQYNNGGSFGGFGDWNGISLSFSADSGSNNYLIGTDAGKDLTSDADYNLVWGYQAASTGTLDNDYNTILGYRAGYNADDASYNVIMGFQAGYGINDGDDNVLIGRNAGYAGEGSSNVFIGYDCGYSINGGENNTAVGTQSGNALTTGDYNTSVGYSAGGLTTTGAYNVYLGYNAGTAKVAATDSNKLVIENSNSATPLIYGEFDNDYLEFNADSVVIPSGYLKCDSIYTLATAAWADDEFKKKQISFEEYQRYWEENSSLKDVYKTGNLAKRDAMIIRQIERNFMYDAELREEVAELKNEVKKINKSKGVNKEVFYISIIILLLVNIYTIIKVIKK